MKFGHVAILYNTLSADMQWENVIMGTSTKEWDTVDTSTGLAFTYECNHMWRTTDSTKNRKHMVACGSVATGHCWTLKVMGSVHMYCVELGKGKGKRGIPVKLKTYQPQHQRFPHFQKVQENIYSFSPFKNLPKAYKYIPPSLPLFPDHPPRRSQLSIHYRETEDNQKPKSLR